MNSQCTHWVNAPSPPVNCGDLRAVVVDCGGWVSVAGVAISNILVLTQVRRNWCIWELPVVAGLGLVNGSVDLVVEEP
jgi:hypothetical protein